MLTGTHCVLSAAATGNRSGKLNGSKAKCVFVPLSQVKYKTVETVFNY